LSWSKVSRIERQYKAIVFDWKGTIAVKRKKHHKRKKWSAIFEAAKHDNPKDGREWSAVQVLAGEIAKESASFADLEVKLLEAEKEYANAQKVAQKSYKTINFLRWFLEEKVGIKSSDVRDRIVDVYMEEFLHKKWFQEPPELYPGAVEVLRRLKKEGVKTALLRNCSLHAKGQRKLLSHFGLDDLFDVIVSLGELDTEGPTEMGYAEIISKLGMDELHKGQPEKILFVGDRTDQDIVGGNKMGWQTCLMMASQTETTSHGLATFEVESWLQLANEVIWPRKYIKKTADGEKKEMGLAQSFEDTLKPITEQNLGINPFIQAVAGHRWQEGKQGFLRGGDRV
jgi:FMN phosphatase YigB (HAD superfamily)